MQGMQYEEGNHLKDLIEGRFTVASLDNLDFLQSHTAETSTVVHI